LLLFGAGGTSVEVVHDTAHALPPLDLNLAQDLMRQTRVWRLLQGYRDRPAAAIGRIAEPLGRRSQLAGRPPRGRELGVNPRHAHEEGLLALDARVAVPRAPPRVPLAIRPYPSEWSIETRIDGLGALRIRPIRPQDEALYTEFSAHVTAEDRELRFFTAAPD